MALTGTYTILITDLELNMSIGLEPKEKDNLQKIFVNAKIIMPTPADFAEDITNTLNYADVIAKIEKIVAQHVHITLLETFSNMILDAIFEDSRVLQASVRAEKPDIFDHVTRVGVEFSRENTHS
ncbi:MAG: dihydroneopterin aldolase [Pseudobdellovibrionaceae bacterium]